MHILLTDILSCPRCGPQYGLILLADHIEQRRVLEGRLGCANCRAQYAVHNGAGNFGSEPLQPSAEASPDAAIRLAALLGLRHGHSYVLVAGPAAAHATELAALIDGLEVIAIAAGDGKAPRAETAGVNRLGVALSLPFVSGRLAAVALTGAYADSLLEEGARVLSPIGRLLLEPPPADAESRLTAAGLRVAARDAVALVAVRA